jgi:hypothetical protein
MIAPKKKTLARSMTGLTILRIACPNVGASATIVEIVIFAFIGSGSSGKDHQGF